MDLDTETGTDAMKQFHNASTAYPAYGKSWSEFQDAYGSKFDIYAEGIGLAIRVAPASSSQVTSAMNALAAQAQGRIPKDHQDYIHALQGQVGSINWLDAAATVATDVVVQTAQGAQALGDGLISGMSWIVKLLPFLMVGAVLAIVYSKTSQASGSDLGLGKIVKAVKSRAKKAVAK